MLSSWYVILYNYKIKNFLTNNQLKLLLSNLSIDWILNKVLIINKSIKK